MPDTENPSVSVRRATIFDLPSITGIYNHYVINTHITFDLDPVTPADRESWFAQFAPVGPHRLFVATADDVVVGYAGTHEYHAKRAYETTVETTIYLDPGFTGRGIGSLLYAALFASLAGEDVELAVAGIALPNEASFKLHQRFGFRPAGIMHRVGRKFEKYWDVAWLEKPLGASS